MKFESYLTEDAQRSKEISIDRFIDLIKTDYSAAWKSITKGGLPIYRGSAIGGNVSAQFGFVDPTKGRLRKSRNTSNETTLFVDNHPSWKAFPDRSQGIISTTQKSYAALYGTVVWVLPKNGVKMGMCPTGDFFGAFPRVSALMASISAFNNFIGSIYRKTSHDSGPVDGNWHNLQTAFKIIDGYVSINGLDNLIELIQMTAAFDYVPVFFKNWKGNMMDTVAWHLDPKVSGFEVKKAGDKLKPRREVWVSGPSLLINEAALLGKTSSGDNKDEVVEYINDLIGG